jgi:hypothetical protein
LLSTVHVPEFRAGCVQARHTGGNAQHYPGTMRSSDSDSGRAARLKKQLAVAGFPSFRLGPDARGIAVGGRHRDWLVAVSDADDWLHATTVVCRMPAEAGAQTRLLLHVMRLNRTLNLVKFSLSDKELSLEADYRAQHADNTVTGELLRHLTAVAEEQYPAIFRIISGDDVLKALETSF